jgi:hypothetical protein
MQIAEITLENIRSFSDKQSIRLSKGINLIVGQNNSGKSTVLNTVLLLQIVNLLTPNDITLGKNTAVIEIVLSGVQYYIYSYGNSPIPRIELNNVVIHFNRDGNSSPRQLYTQSRQESSSFNYFPNNEPQNLIYPYLSKRKVGEYDESVNQQATAAVTGNFQHLVAKILRLCNVNHPNSQEYQIACKEILGFPISTVASGTGHRAAYLTSGFSEIPLTAMGDGIPNLLGLIVDLCIAENKIFLIEELENDIHPKALKSLLNLIERKSERNQFIISTHSNIVTKFLGSVENTKVFKVSMEIDSESKLPVSHIAEVSDDQIERIQLLEELGYEPFDYGQWKAWLILEESSAEVIIRDFLLPTFVPKLKNKLRTYSARSLNEVEPKFKDFNNLFVFIHLEQIYKNRAWVLVDAGDNEKAIIDSMKATYSDSGWLEENFLQLSEHDFEKYYPERFQDQVDEVLLVANKKEKMRRKLELLEEVKDWYSNHPVEAKAEFAISAKEVIEILKTINRNT